MATESFKQVVFDAGKGNNFSVSGLNFIDGIYVANEESQATLLRNFIRQTGSDWQEVALLHQNQY